ncbi:MAG: bifunctional serine/threonine-protein kinase/formylglycine-generating enzyme family protein [Planctomycetota bacterium]
MTPELTHEEEREALRLFDEVSELPAAVRAQRVNQIDASSQLKEWLLRMLVAADDETREAALDLEEILDSEDALSLFEDNEPARLPDTFDGYELIDLVGRGGMGVVYKAREIDTQRLVAIKIVNQRSPKEHVLERFARERLLHAMLDRHPAIVDVRATGAVETTSGLRPYLVLEFINGKPFHEWAESIDRDPMRIAKTASIAADALAHAHKRRIIHRDIKPENVLVDEDDAPFVLDFGVSRAIDHSVRLASLTTDASQVLGTVAYAAPEQLKSRTVDFRADVYSIGAMMYRALTRQLPIPVQGLPIGVAISKICDSQPTPIAEHREDLHPDLEAIVTKCIEPEREDRYATAGDLHDDLENFIAGRPVRARKPSALRKARRAAKRNLALLVTVTVVLSLGLLLAQSRLNSARRERESAQALTASAGAVLDLLDIAATTDSTLFSAPLTPNDSGEVLEMRNQFELRTEAWDQSIERLAQAASLSAELDFDERLSNARAALDWYRNRTLPYLTRTSEWLADYASWTDLYADRWERAITHVEEGEWIANFRAFVEANEQEPSDFEMKVHPDLMPIEIDGELWTSEDGYLHFLHLPSHRGSPELEFAEDPVLGRRLIVTPDTGIVFMLVIPPIHHPEPKEHWTRPPYFLSLHSITRAQWTRLAPSLTVNERVEDCLREAKAAPQMWTHPMVSVSAIEASRALAPFDLRIPEYRELIPAWEEFEWRGPSTAPGSAFDPATIHHWQNIYVDPESPLAAQFDTLTGASGARFRRTSPVDAFPPNPAGFYDINGNVSDICSGSAAGFDIMMGAHFAFDAEKATQKFLVEVKSTHHYHAAGFRAARYVQR